MQTLATPITFITDDMEAKAFLASENQLQNMVPIEPYDHVCILFGTEYAYVGATYDCGHPDPKDNGYTVLIILRDAMNINEARELLVGFQQAGKLYPDCPSYNIVAVN
jgi:hypothetical protein